MPTGSKIKEIRQQKGLTQKQLGDLCGMADSAIRRYENGNANPKIETLQKIATALDEPLSIFLDDELFDASTDDKDLGTDHVSEILNKRMQKIAQNTDLTNTEKANMINDLITSNHIILQESINHSTVAQKQLLSFYFNELNMNGRNKALDQVEMLTKIRDYRKDMIPDQEIMKHELLKDRELGDDYEPSL